MDGINFFLFSLFGGIRWQIHREVPDWRQTILSLARNPSRCEMHPSSGDEEMAAPAKASLAKLILVIRGKNTLSRERSRPPGWPLGDQRRVWSQALIVLSSKVEIIIMHFSTIPLCALYYNIENREEGGY